MSCVALGIGLDEIYQVYALVIREVIELEAAAHEHNKVKEVFVGNLEIGHDPRRDFIDEEVFVVEIDTQLQRVMGGEFTAGIDKGHASLADVNDMTQMYITVINDRAGPRFGFMSWLFSPFFLFV